MDIIEIYNNRCGNVRKLTSVVDAFLREACDRIETHGQYVIIQKYHVRKKSAAEKMTCYRNAFRAAGSTCAPIKI